MRRHQRWRPLTDHLYLVILDARPGLKPSGDHLADAVYTATIEGRGGAVCDIVFFPRLIGRELRRWAAGRLVAPPVAGPPPEPVRFWGALLGHELTHCAPGPPRRRREAAAAARERRLLRL